MHRSIRHLPLLLLALVLLASRAHAFGWPGDNDNIFPPAPAAKNSINFDGRGFMIDGKRTFIAAGALHYSRVPRALWRDRLLRIKRAGYNTVQTYVFWNFHEYKEGKFDFSGDRDFGAYLKLIHSLGMYAIVRVGPYDNAEWNSGGWPIWMRFKQGMVVRTDDKKFLFYLDRWLDHLMPIVASNQINHGGAVIMVQLENEDSRGAGTDLPDAYFKHLRDKCVALGLQVPYFFSGLNHSDNPAGDDPFDITKRTSPWYSSEFWTGWIQFYGSDPDRTEKRIRATWNVIANGGAGYSHYTMAGGSDFADWACDAQAASYDFGAPIGQAGDLRPMYYGFKRAALFATSFQRILANAPDSTPKHKADAVGTGVDTVARTGPAGTIVFLRNQTAAAVKAQVKDSTGKAFPAAGPLTLDPNEIMPIVEDYALAPGVRLNLAATHTLGTLINKNSVTLVIFGSPGDPAELHFTAVNTLPVVVKPAKSGAQVLTVSGREITYAAKIPALGPALSEFTVGPQIIRIIAVSGAMADHTYFVDMPDGSRDAVCGPDYVGEVGDHHGKMLFQTEQAVSDKGPALPTSLIAASGPIEPLVQTALSRSKQGKSQIPLLSAWLAAPGDTEAKPGYDDSHWKASKTPLAMGADGDISSYAWYRTTVDAPQAGSYSLNFSDIGDWVTVFVNGVHASSSAVQQRFKNPVTASLPVTLKAGHNSIAILAAEYGREKLHAYIGTLNEIDAKGISGPVTLGNATGAHVALTQWRYKLDSQGEADAAQISAPDLKTDSNGWQAAAVGQDLFNAKPGFAWLRMTLPNISGKNIRVHFGSVDDNATVYLNGKRLFHNTVYNQAFDVPLDSAWKPGGPNILTVLDENTNGTGGLTQGVDLLSDPADNGAPIDNWKMRGGVIVPKNSAWQKFNPKSVSGAPTFYETHFSMTPPAAEGPHPIIRIATDGLSRGHLWLNGHDLGRYPEVSPVNGYYMPECWLKNGVNTIVIFDEEGKSPESVKMVEETIASRVGYQLTTAPGDEKRR